MTGEVSPVGDSAGPGPAPELRVSHADRDRVVDILNVAAGDGRLSAAELDERLEAALTARTGSWATRTSSTTASPVTTSDIQRTLPGELVLARWTSTRSCLLTATAGIVSSN